MPTNLANKTVLVYDNGLYVSMANKLGETFKKVYYYTEWAGNGFPTPNQAHIGFGYDNIERVESWEDIVDKIDLFIFTDLYHAATQFRLEQEGRRVWGARFGEELELDRVLCKKEMKKRDLLVNPYKVLKGTDELIAYLKANKDVHVKVSKYRGVKETFKSTTYDEVRTIIAEMVHQLGELRQFITFIAEKNLPDMVEIGYDGFCIDGKYPEASLVGIEIKDLGYIGEFVPYKNLPKEITDFTNSMSDVFAEYNYRQFMHPEFRVNNKQESYMIDLTCRCGSPPSELYQEFYSNLPEIMWSGADGKLVNPIPIAKYGVEIIFRSEWADQNWQPIIIDEEVERWVKIRNGCKIDGIHYPVPLSIGLYEIGAILGVGETIEEAIDHAIENAEGVSGYHLDIPKGSLDKAQEEMEKLKEFGINLFS